MTKIMMMGDLHCDWAAANRLINKKKPELILQCGDFGFWEGEKVYKSRRGYIMGVKPIELWPPTLKLGGSKLYWVAGNHESWWKLQEKYGRRGIHPLEMEDAPGIYYCPLGSLLQLPDNRVVLFMGGAESIDKDSRTLGRDWFPDETITYADIVDLPDVSVDIVVSHTCPVEFDMIGTVDTANEKFNDPSKEALSTVLNYYKPSLWYFGHYHKYATGYTKGCRWYALSMPTLTGWWKWLD